MGCYIIDTTTIKDIRMSVGTTLSFNMVVTGEDSIAFDAVEFTCREKMSDTIIFQKTLSNGITVESETEDGVTTYTYTIRVAPEDTDDVECGKYFYDLRCKSDEDEYSFLAGELAIVR